MKAVGDRLRRVMKSLDLSQRDLANAIGVSEGQMSRWIKGINKMPRATAMGLQAAYAVRWEWLLNGEGAEFLPKSHSLTAKEKKLLAIFHTVPLEYQDYLIDSFRKNSRMVQSLGQKVHSTVEEWKGRKKR